MKTIPEPYTIRYPNIVGLADKDGKRIELIEFFDCIGGAMWVKNHYCKSSLVRSVRTIGSTNRYMLDTGSIELDLKGSYFPAGISEAKCTGNEISISYLGMGGGGVGASICRSKANGVIRSTSDESGGGKIAGSTIVIPRRERVLIGVDDTDTPEEGATWTLCHNIARTVEDEHSCYLSHTITQLYPVPYRTKNCVSIVCEFASTQPDALVDSFRELLELYTLSEDTGMAVYRAFEPSERLVKYGEAVKQGEVDSKALEEINDDCLDLVIRGRGIIGAVAAIPYYTRFKEALKLWNG